MKKIKLNKRDCVVLLIIAFVIWTAFVYILNQKLMEYKFAKQLENLYTKNEEPVFALDKIFMYSSANAIDNSENKTMQDLNVCQFTDIDIYIDNMVDIRNLVKEANAMNASTVNTNDEASRKVKEHTIKELYIDKIKINSTSARGIKTFFYKKPETHGSFVVSDIEQPSRIDFKIISKNVDNDSSDYSEPTFYADCSNPITLGYFNKNIVTGYSVSAQDTKIKFDGSILQSLGINLADIACSIDFDVHMKNNLDQNFVCSVRIDIPLSSENRSIYGGYMYTMENELQEKYKFFKY